MAATSKPLRNLMKKGVVSKKRVEEIKAMKHPKFASPTASEKKNAKVRSKMTQTLRQEHGSKYSIKPLSEKGQKKIIELHKKIPKSKKPKHV